MKNKILAFAIAVTFFASCKEKTEEQVVTEQEMEQPEVSVSAKDCYLYVKAKDTVRLTLITANGNNVSGDLVYNFFEKDKNSGTVSGMFKGDTLYADYTFQSEGTSSVRETVFIKKGTTLIEGFGEITEKGNKQVFKDKKALKFDESVVLNKVECE